MSDLEAEERAIWRVMLDAAPDDRLTVTEIAAVASALAGRNVPHFVVHETVQPLLRHGHACRVRRSGHRRQAWAYWLTGAGRVRAARLLA